MKYTALPAEGPISGSVRVPGDKSISHRALILAAMSNGVSHLKGIADSADVRSTMSAITALGATITEESRDETGITLAVEGWGSKGPSAPSEPLDCGNSATTVRLLMGVVSGWPISVTFTGDESLSKRPMDRVMDPLTAMGASFTPAEGGVLPIKERGAFKPKGFTARLPVASAQVKSALMLAAVRADNRVIVFEPANSRDHTERMFPYFGLYMQRDLDRHSVWVDPLDPPRAADLAIPGDPSSAAFLAGAAVLVPGSDVSLPGVCVNPTRTGFARVLERMGANLTITRTQAPGGEPVGKIQVLHSEGLKATRIEADEIPSLIDEVPLLAVMATQAEGTTRFEGIGELKVKETDRIAAIKDGLASLGVTVRTEEDWLEIDGPVELHAAPVDSRGDHRLAMALAVAGLIADGGVDIAGWESVDVSYPGFESDLSALRQAK